MTEKPDKAEAVDPDVVSVEKVDHADGTYSIVVQYEGPEGIRLYPPEGKKRMDFQDQAERDTQAEHWESLVKPQRRGSRATTE